MYLGPLGCSIDLISSILFQRPVTTGLLYHRTIPDFGQIRGFVRMAGGELPKTVAKRRKV